MFYYLYQLSERFSFLRIFQYITFRALAAAGTAFMISLIAGPWLIRALRRFKIGQQIRTEDSETLLKIHGKKAGTPTMGGLLIILAAVVSTLLWAVPSNLYVQLTLATLCFMGGVGFWDDYLKLRRRQSKGLDARGKMLLQTGWVVLMAAVLLSHPATADRTRNLMVPFLKNPLITNMGLLGSLIFIWLIIAGSTNAVNLTDGLDGLAAGCTGSVALAYLFMAYVAGHYEFATYLQVPFVKSGGELAVFCGALLGASLGFLWLNCHPAKVFMGDTGSLALGGGIAMVAILIKQELTLIIVGGVFVAEALSVMLQVAYFKFTGGRRIFLCAPLHHHYEFLEKKRAEEENRDLEVVETMITTRFWIVSIICALIGVATLKIR
ncbi:MAG TPA: phospho-N-acetylmuramoyl-pentapeptide-transferase [Kiritimatiellia bacterium]|nr:phospho-N-acetylmuramoyl-pentapeptide-transferase [Kiritimatiellia bacterium]